MITLTPEEQEEYNKNNGIRTNFHIDGGVVEEFFDSSAILEYSTPVIFGSVSNTYIKEYRNPETIISDSALLVVEYAVTSTEDGEKTWIEVDDMTEVTVGNYLWYRVSLSEEPDDPVYLFSLTMKYKLDTRIEDNIVNVGALQQTLQQGELNNFKNGNMALSIKSDRGEITRLNKVLGSVNYTRCFFDIYMGFVDDSHLVFRGIVADGSISVDPQTNTASINLVDFTEPMRKVKVDDYFKVDGDWLTNRTTGFAVNFALNKWGVNDRSLVSSKPFGTDYGIQEYGVVSEGMLISQDFGSHIVAVFLRDNLLRVRKWDKLTYDGDGNPIWQTIGTYACADTITRVDHISCKHRPDLFGYQLEIDREKIYYILINRVNLSVQFGVMTTNATSILSWIISTYPTNVNTSYKVYLGFNSSGVLEMWFGAVVYYTEVFTPPFGSPINVKRFRCIQCKSSTGIFNNTNIIYNTIIQPFSEIGESGRFWRLCFGNNNIDEVSLFGIFSDTNFYEINATNNYLFGLSAWFNTEFSGPEIKNLQSVQFTKQGYLIRIKSNTTTKEVTSLNNTLVFHSNNIHITPLIIPNTDSLTDVHFAKDDKIYRWNGTALVEVDTASENITGLWGGNYTGQKSDRDYALFVGESQQFGALSLDEVTVENFNVFEGKSLYDTLALISASYNFYFGQTSGKIYLTDSLISDGFIIDDSNTYDVNDSKIDIDSVYNRVNVVYDGITGIVELYANLPTASTKEDEYFTVRTDTLVDNAVTFSKGTYFSDGSTWEKINELTDTLLKLSFDNTESITKFGIRETTIEIPHIQRHDIAETIAEGYLDKYSIPFYSVSLSVRYSPHLEILDGGRIDLGDIAFGSVSRLLELSHDYQGKRTMIKSIMTEDPNHSWYGINEYGADSEFG